jgi:hypothetical protein
VSLQKQPSRHVIVAALWADRNPSPETEPPDMRPSAAFAAAALPLLLLAGCSSSPAQITAHGKLAVDYDTSAGDDLSDGSQVVVVNSAGTVVGNATLTQVSTPAGAPVFLGDSEDDFAFKVTVPGGLPRYGIQIGGTGHGTTWESAGQMTSGPSLEIDETTAGGGY